MSLPPLEEIVARHGAAILRRCRGMLGDAQAAQDAAQDVFVTLLTQGGKFRGEADVTTWIYRITTNHCLNVIRGEQRRQQRDADERATGWMVQHPTSADEAYAIAQTLARLKGEFDAHNQAIFVYRYQDGLGQEEIATLTGLSRRTVGTRLKQIQQQLQHRAEGAI